MLKGSNQLSYDENCSAVQQFILDILVGFASPCSLSLFVYVVLNLFFVVNCPYQFYVSSFLSFLKNNVYS
jgi:hypothetical protein